MITFACLYCRKTLKAADTSAGTLVKCGCGGTCIVPVVVAIPLPEPPDPFSFHESSSEPEEEERPRRKPKKSRKALKGGVGFIPIACGVLTITFMVGALAVVGKMHRMRNSSDDRDGLASENLVWLCLIMMLVFWSVTCVSFAASQVSRSPVLASGAIGALIGGVLSIPISQYAPVFGGFLSSIAAPWSYIRINDLPVHFFGVSAAVGGLFALVKSAGSTRED